MRRTLLVALASLTTLAGGVALAQEAPRQMPTPEDIFKRWDTNGDGVVDKTEWDATGRPAENFARIDTNNDGKVTLDELKVAFEKMRARRAQEGGPPPGPPPEGQPPQGN